MKEFLLLLMLVGLCSCLQEKLHYRYKYVGSAFSGSPELSNDGAGWAMKAFVDVYVENNDGVALFKLSDFKMAKYNGDFGCDVRNEIPDNIFSEPEDVSLKKAVESPFKTRLYHFYEDYAIEYLETKFKWLTNMRKGIAAIFKNEILKGNFDNPLEGTVADALHKGHVLNIFSVQEETMFGRCKVDYSIYPIPKHLAGIRNRKFEEMMEEDEQHDPESAAYTSKTKTKTKTKTGKTSKKAPGKSPKGKIAAGKYTKPDAPKLKRDLWHVVRSVDFDECDERVEIQMTPLGFQHKVGGNQEGWTRGRSSVSEYIFRGAPGHFRLERAIVEGANTLAPVAMLTELFQVRINQTLQLVSVNAGGAAPAMPIKAAVGRSKTWMYEMLSFAPPPKVSKQHPWVIYTGEGPEINYLQSVGIDQITPEQITEMKAAIIKHIEAASSLMGDLEQIEVESPHISIANYMDAVSTLMKSFYKKEDILELFDHFFRKETHDRDILAKKLVVDGAAASGTAFAYDAVFDYIEQGKIPDLQIMTIFMGLNSNALSHSPIRRSMDYVLSLGMKPFLSATALVNLARLIRTRCLNPNAREIQYLGALYGDSGCDMELIKHTFLPYLQNIILSEDTSVKSWEREVAIRTLEALGTPLSFPVLAPVVEGRVNCDNRIRSVAISALQRWKLMQFQGIRQQVMDLLTDVYSDISEPLEVRQAALTAVTTWGPDGNFWHRLARTSWREPSRNFASFMTATIQSYADFTNDLLKKQNQAASHALLFAKPNPASSRHSHLIKQQNYDLDKNTWMYEELSWYSLTEAGKLPSLNTDEIYYFFMSSLGGVELHELELSLSHKRDTPIKEYQKMFMKATKKEKAEGFAAKIAQKFYDEVKETLGYENIYRDNYLMAHVYLRLFDNMQLFLPLNTLTADALFSQHQLGMLLVNLRTVGQTLVLGKYFKPVDLFTVHPSELGLPIITTTTVSITFGGPSHSTAAIGELNMDSVKAEIASELLARVSTSFTSSLAVLLPWNQELLTAGINSKRDLMLPMSVVASKDKHKSNDVTQDILTLSVSSLYKNKFHLLSASSTPYAAVVPLYLIDLAKENFNVPKHSDVKSKIWPFASTYLGLDFEILWKSELGSLFSDWKLIESMQYVDPKTIPWLHVLLGTHTAKPWSLQVDFDPNTSQSKNGTLEFKKATFGKEKEDITQSTGQETQDYDGQLTQESQDFDQYDQKSDDIGKEFQEITPGHEVETLSYVSSADTLDVRGKILQKHFGGSTISQSIKLEYSGEASRVYELLIAGSAPKVSGTRKLVKSQVSFLRGPIPGVDDKHLSVCIDTQKSLPVFSNLDTVESLLEADLDKKVDVEVTLDCKGKPIFTLKSLHHHSDEWKQKLQKELPEMCDHDPYNFLRSFHSHTFYDQNKYTISWNEVCDNRLTPAMDIFKVAETLVVGFGLKDRCHSSEPKPVVKIDVHRCPIRGDWHVDIEKDEIKVQFELIPHNEHLGNMYSLEKDTEDFSDEDSLYNFEFGTCVIGMDSVRTFDGFVYEFEGTPCWTVAAKECNADNAALILVRAPEGEAMIPEAKYVDPHRGLIVDISGRHVKVNGKEIDPVGESEIVRDNDGDFLVAVRKRDDYFMVKFAGNVYITVKEKLRLHTPTWNKKIMCGLCGNFDNEPEAEFVGAHRCIYDNPKTFAASWTAGSDKCDDYTLYGLREEAEKYQKNCSKIDDLQKTCSYFNRRCFKYEWMVRPIENQVCVSDSPLPHCDEGCSSYGHEVESVRFRCWYEHNTPPAIKDAFVGGKTFIDTPVWAEAYTYDNVHVSLPIACKYY